MTRAPLLFGEMIHLSRSPRTWALRAGFVMFLASAAALAWPWSGAAGGFHAAGRALFQVFFWTEFVAGLVLVPAMVAPAIAWERERATLDLLSVAPVTDFDIVSGKLLANGALTATTLAAGLPVGFAALLLGGVTPEVLAATVVALLLNGLFAASVSILMSATSDRAGTATGLTLVTLIVFLAVSGALGGVAAGFVSSGGTKSLPFSVMAFLCPWSATIRDAVAPAPAPWLDRGLAWTAHLLEAAAALWLSSVVLRNARSPRGRGRRPLAAPVEASGVPMAFFPPSAIPAQGPIVPTFLPGSRPAPAGPVLPPIAAFRPAVSGSRRLPIQGNPVYWKDRQFDDSTARQVLTLFGTIACAGALGCNVLFAAAAMLSSSGRQNAAVGAYTLVFDLVLCVVLAIGAGASTLGPERLNGTLPILLSTGLPVRQILAGKLLASLRSIAPVLVAGIAHAALAALTMGRWGPLAFAVFVAAVGATFTIACTASLAAGDPRRASAAATAALFGLWAVPSLAALPFRSQAVPLTSLNPFGLLLRCVSAASDGSLAAPSLPAAALFVAASAAVAAACLAGAVSALEARIRA
ncbi:MAG: ABC transporter permease [Planctomycetia bacterium]|nr:ABC transporter permease [Planctomycetia bacterium]